jgi:hypothetical protein
MEALTGTSRSTIFSKTSCFVILRVRTLFNWWIFVPMRCSAVNTLWHLSPSTNLKTRFRNCTAFAFLRVSPRTRKSWESSETRKLKLASSGGELACAEKLKLLNFKLGQICRELVCTLHRSCELAHERKLQFGACGCSSADAIAEPPVLIGVPLMFQIPAQLTLLPPSAP